MKKLIPGLLIGCFLFTFCNMAIGGDSKFVASANSNKYHYTWCKWAQKIKPSNMVVFNSPGEAQAAGYIPCKVCKPPVR